MSDVVDLEAHRAAADRPVETITLTIELFRDADSQPRVTFETDRTRDIDRAVVFDVDLERICSAISFAMVSVGGIFGAAGEQQRPVASVLIYPSGLVSVTTNVADFVAPARRRWLDRCIDRAKEAFARLVDRESGSASNAEPVEPSVPALD